MSTPDPISPGRYRRRILGLGALALVVTFAIGAAIFIPVVQKTSKTGSKMNSRRRVSTA